MESSPNGKTKDTLAVAGMLYYCIALYFIPPFVPSFLFLFLAKNSSFIVTIHHYLGLHIDCSCIFRSVNEIMYQLNAMLDASDFDT